MAVAFGRRTKTPGRPAGAARVHALRPPESPVAVSGGGPTALAVGDLERSIRFYGRVFGFRTLDAPVFRPARHDARRSVIMTDGQSSLALHEEPLLSKDTRRLPAAPARFAVRDLDGARAALWNLGVPLARGTGEPVEADADGGARSLFVSDPDGHRLELVEMPGGPGGP